MKSSVRNILYALLVIFMILTFYAIFNAGNPNSLFRYLIEDPSYDVTITVILSIIVLVLVVLLTSGRSENIIRHLLDINRDHIREMRRKGKSDEQIAESFLDQLGSRRGLLHVLVKRRVLRYLSRLE